MTHIAVIFLIKGFILLAYLKNGNYNVFSVDWGPLAKEPCYFSAARSVPVVGKCAATLVDAIAAAGVPPDRVHIVGFSLGSHVSGHASRKARVGKVGRITGLDPALPMFASTFDEPVLDPTDATFVDVIHTNAGNKGKLGPNGHVDFYANGGFMQPGCDSSRVYDKHSCSHSRAAELFAESIGSKEGFWGTPCPDWIDRIMGRCAGKSDNQQLMGERVDKR
ncbi:hypothetical protein J437_LFUL007027 [Ladona fulva]|uniref:Lipase domain-containing protein n=1 Tax=Ladona fulva TaxID=123851 RepID=A0A8K0K4N8_LADFU|nr:hypothetical protein J437_LFUL007027 [Ladona fulva]